MNYSIFLIHVIKDPSSVYQFLLDKEIVDKLDLISWFFMESSGYEAAFTT